MGARELDRFHGEDPRILVVDDNLTVVEVIREHLLEWGYEVTTARSGVEAQKHLESQQRYHVVLADIRMSPVSGWEVIRQAKEIEGTQVVVMTGFISLDNSLEAIRHGVFDFLEKPLDFERLRRVVRNAVRQSHLILENRRLVEELERKNLDLESEIDKVREELEELTIRDELTGLYNYRYLMNLLEQEISRSLRYGHPATLAMIDLDDFKKLNDTYGHSAGNKALKAIASVFRDSIRAADTVCRFGGEEFAVVLPMTTPEQAAPILDRICQSIRRQNIPVDPSQHLTISVGVAACPRDARDIDNLIRLADQALYRAKEKGKDRVVLATKGALQ
ncbi:MAG: diguanylate cyclase [Candidatus Omnitrophica bacterium]|nr:diguanylate cyclase [Candidatus Omnitrophota bacterium]MCA9424069.1 diguanylate cyclase [Candidatus Omnitrophota bacterium]MCA9429102.1 diguanylate cyclase [Candidatus Omnitrophota bacterium]